MSENSLSWKEEEELENIIGFDKIRDDIRASIQAGKHLILYGPPGTGKTMIAKQLAKCFGCKSVLTTATPEWTAIDTLGGPYPDGLGLADRDGVITKAIRETNELSEVSACWVVIDEINRAKLDVALGPFFTMMDSENNTIHLSNFIEPEDLHVPDTFRIIGTMNTIDKNFLNRFPEALKRRFAWIKVDVPDQKKVGDEFETLMKQEKIQIGNNNKQENPWYYRIQDCVEKLRYGQAEQNGKTVPVGKGTPLYPVGTAIVKDALKLGKEYQGLNENEDEDRQDHQKLEGEALNKYIADRAMSHTIIPLLESIDFYNNDKTEALENIFTESDYPSCWKELRSFYPEEQ